MRRRKAERGRRRMPHGAVQKRAELNDLWNVKTLAGHIPGLFQKFPMRGRAEKGAARMLHSMGALKRGDALRRRRVTGCAGCRSAACAVHQQAAGPHLPWGIPRSVTATPASLRTVDGVVVGAVG